jgi:hypothetical protein
MATCRRWARISGISGISGLVLLSACGAGRADTGSEGGTAGMATNATGNGSGTTNSSSGSESDSTNDSMSTTMAQSSTEGESSSGPWIDPDCPDIHEGTLTIDGTTDVDALRLTGRVTGNLVVKEFEGQDLEFLACLHVVDWGVAIRDNPNLTSFLGLGSLNHIGGGVWIDGNPILTTTADLGPVAKLGVLDVGGNGSLTALDLPHLEAVDSLLVGECRFSFQPSYDNPMLQTLDGLSGLTSLGEVIIGSQSSLVSIARLHEIAAAGGMHGDASFNHNPSLPIEDVELLVQLSNRFVLHCGNLGESETNACSCPIPN